MTAAVPVPRKAATLVVVRKAPGGFETLLLRRAENGDHNSGAWVFPGGLLDAADRNCHTACVGLDDAAASARLGLAQGGLDYYIAAIRECFEEAGLLFAVDEHEHIVSMLGNIGPRLAALRGALHQRSCGMADICRDFGLRLAADQLFYIAHWLTPLGRAKRFDTRFFLAVLPERQTSRHDEVEILDQIWLRPGAALSPENTRRMLTPTRSVIEMIGRFASLDALLAWARSPREVTGVLPRLSMYSGGLRPVMSHEPAWAEIGRLDPHGRGTAWSELQPGVAVRLSPRVLRITSPGEGGFNSYLVGNERDGWAVIDPGTGAEAHVEALITAASGRIRWILPLQSEVSPAAVALAKRTGATVRDPVADVCEPMELFGGTTVRVIPALGDAAQFFCYLLIEEKTLFTGTAQPDIAALLAAAPDGLEWLAPGQGFLTPGPQLQFNLHPNK